MTELQLQARGPHFWAVRVSGTKITEHTQRIKNTQTLTGPEWKPQENSFIPSTSNMKEMNAV